MKYIFVWMLALLANIANAQSSCHRSTIVEPQPFLATENEIIILSDGSVWKDVSYKYLYLYAYSPSVVICPSKGQMILEHGDTKHVFSVVRMNVK